MEYIAKLVMDAINEKEVKGGFAVKVGVSARHVHLTQEQIGRASCRERVSASV